MCAISKECVLKYDKNSYANMGIVRTYLGNLFSRNVLQYCAIISCDANSFFYVNGKINPLKVNPLKEVLINQAV